ncbi:MAG: NADH-quinone oxidoreductase subunit C [Gammaproteobacteria bacterium CG_4_10_14_0_8_um_filter_38_16]|nr:MAG: NADH-quinone oxidoreductase subunit C [Gammaproteobacteria bacterium CG_4_10_14_0_8_um_filter_38_16]PJA02879.1 MAG: NADH-quinone oxidoreductase subunit C [Gammaproteobacteria bacterium CG_4_10_14_0_2_um_filter_38_22]PJB10957.1 MAG: NADH-quinone oxidoreductase subunit C [Gammaproteobacteria bacterium CG_4_9_14_3_um_filter_38_9]
MLIEKITQYFSDKMISAEIKDCLTIEVAPENLLFIAKTLRDEFHFEVLIDVCGVDYADYGISHWRTIQTTESGFSRGVSDEGERVIAWDKPRFASVYHLLSLSNNMRIRIKVFLASEPIVPSVIDIWKSADWFERESYDLFGIVYEGHPDLRRILTDYGFKGHPFRKDFPLIGDVEMRYDAKQQRCVYEPVSIESRTLVPKVIREDNRYV